MTTRARSFLERLEAFDGRDATPICGLVDEVDLTGDDLAELCDLARRPDLADGATWVIKNAADRYALHFGARESQRILALLDVVTSWGATMHLLHLVRHTTITKARKDGVLRAVLEHTEHPRPFVRAWAYDALARIAEAHPEHRDQAAALFDHAVAHDAASIRARIRNLREHFPWATT